MVKLSSYWACVVIWFGPASAELLRKGSCPPIPHKVLFFLHGASLAGHGLGSSFPPNPISSDYSYRPSAFISQQFPGLFYSTLHFNKHLPNAFYETGRVPNAVMLTANNSYNPYVHSIYVSMGCMGNVQI